MRQEQGRVGGLRSGSQSCSGSSNCGGGGPHSMLGRPTTWFVTLLSILLSVDFVCWALSSRPAPGAGQNLLSAAWCGPTCCANTRSAASPRGSWDCSVNQTHSHTHHVGATKWIDLLGPSSPKTYNFTQQLNGQHFCTRNQVLKQNESKSFIFLNRWDNFLQLSKSRLADNVKAQIPSVVAEKNVHYLLASSFYTLSRLLLEPSVKWKRRVFLEEQLQKMYLGFASQWKIIMVIK